MKGTGSYRSQDVVCPFYLYDDSKKQKISCENVTAGSSSIQVFYSKRADFVSQMENFCCSLYVNCPICEILMRKYEE